MAELILGSTVALGGQDSILKPDANGYYNVILSTFNVFNRGGTYYDFDSSVSDLIKKSSTMRIRLNNQQLKGEYGHPKFKIGESEMNILKRTLEIEETRVCMFIKEVTFSTSTKVTPETGDPIIIVRGLIKPTGPYGDTMKREMEDTDINSAWSLRGRFLPGIIQGRPLKKVTDIITWDYVNSQGLPHADKLGSLTMEDDSEIYITPESLDPNEFANLITAMGSVTNEADRVGIDRLIKDIKACKGSECLVEYWK